LPPSLQIQKLLEALLRLLELLYPNSALVRGEEEHLEDPEEDLEDKEDPEDKEDKEDPDDQDQEDHQEDQEERVEAEDNLLQDRNKFKVAVL
jgi:hypothetical protein